MSNATSSNLRAGDWVEVRSKEEILATLDENGCIDGMPFMPEMLQYCGKRFRVFKRAHKSCDTVNMTGGLRLKDSVHLEELRCDGTAHGECHAACLLFWKTAWLSPVGQGNADVGKRGTLRCEFPSTCDEAALARATTSAPDVDGSGPCYSCQATRLPAAARPLPWWDFRQYVEDYTSGNVGLAALASGAVYASFSMLLNRGLPGGRVLIRLYDLFQRVVRGVPYPRHMGRVPPGAATPTCTLGLQLGEEVRVREYEQILETLDRANKNRGLYFDAEEVPYCGQTFRVSRQVTQIIDEKSGRMIRFRQPSVILAGAYCQARYSDRRMFCPRAVYPIWREIWLERTKAAGQMEQTRSRG